jgi:hypothetical protein
MQPDPHLIPIVPDHVTGITCPECASPKVTTRGTIFPGIHVMGDHVCDACGLEFLQDIQVGFAVQHPVALRKSDGRLYNISNAGNWLVDPLLRSYSSPATRQPSIERVVHRTTRRIVILNCLDFLYGHVLLKLFNARHYLDEHKDRGLVLILPRMFAWLVPEGTAEVWLVDQRLGDAHGWYAGIDAFVQERLKEYEEVHMARGYAHPDQSRIDIGRFTGIRPFDPEEFDDRPRHITFIARRDRLWLGGRGQSLMHRFLLRYKLAGRHGGWLVRGQAARIRETMRIIRRSFPDVRFSVVGLDSAGGFEGLANDLRAERMDVEREKLWCRAYAESQVVVGVHGSNMLLPTAFAAGAVEILPRDRHGNIVQDIFVRYTDRMQLFFYRFVREHATPQEVADHCTSMLRDHATYRRNMCVYTV